MVSVLKNTYQSLAQIRNQALAKGAWSAAVNAEVARGKAGGIICRSKACYDR